MPDSLATHHPKWLSGWVQGAVLVLNRVDMILPQAQVWMKWFKAQSTLISPMPKMVRCGICGTGGAKAGVEINQRRRDRGMLPRPVRAV